MDYLEAILLGLIQGATEFLPVSSSGHLLLTQKLLGLDENQFGLTFDVALHVGTLLALLFFFRRDLLALPRALGVSRKVADRAPQAVPVMAGGRGYQATEPESQASPLQADLFTPRLIGMIMLACVPAVLAGVFLSDFFEKAVREPLVVAVMLAGFGLLMLVADRVGRTEKGLAELTWQQALLIGLAQSLALIPGVSRAGITITTALFLGQRRDEAARFSFLLAMPIIAGAAAKEGLKFFKEDFSGNQIVLMLIGIITSALVGYLALRFLVRFLTSYSLAVFTYYRLALAAVVVVIFTLFR